MATCFSRHRYQRNII